MPRNLSGWLAGLLGPLFLRVAGVDVSVPHRSTFNFVNIRVEDDPDNDCTNIIAGGGGGQAVVELGDGENTLAEDQADARILKLIDGDISADASLVVAGVDDDGDAYTLLVRNKSSFACEITDGAGTSVSVGAGLSYHLVVDTDGVDYANTGVDDGT